MREGDDVTIVAFGRMVHIAPGGCGELAEEGVECEIIDLRTISPLDEDTILESVEKTGRLVVVDEAYPRCNMATDISAMVAQKALRLPAGADPHGDAAAHARPFQRRAGRPVHARCADAVIADAVHELVSELMKHPIHALTMPKWGLSMQKGQINGWLKTRAQSRAGRRIGRHRNREDYAVRRVGASGILRRQIGRRGREVPVGGLLGIVADASVPDARDRRLRRRRSARILPATAKPGRLPARLPERFRSAGSRCAI